MELIKHCSKCGTSKPLSCFYKNKNSPDKHTHWCKMCCRESGDLYYKKNTIAVSAAHKKYRDNNPVKVKIENVKRMLYSAKHRARMKGLPFNIDESDIVIPEVCPILKVDMLFSEGKMSRNSPSIDRIIPELGYVKGNVQVISWQANTLKNNATPSELILFAEWINKTFKKDNDD